jgi:hypothetical protein
MIAAVDEFILYDDVQYTNNDWRNRNLIKVPGGTLWLTIPIRQKGRFGQLICETEINGTSWQGKHWKSFVQYYRKAKYFEEVSALLAPFYLERSFTLLSDLNQSLIESISSYLGVSTVLSRSDDYRLEGDRSQRLVNLCRQAGASVYISGPAAKNYLEVGLFEAAGLEVRWFDYDNFPVYPQLGGEFIHAVSIVDLLFNCGPDSFRYLRHARDPLCR